MENTQTHFFIRRNPLDIRAKVPTLYENGLLKMKIGRNPLDIRAKVPTSPLKQPQMAIEVVIP